jgi:hypothetical protein
MAQSFGSNVVHEWHVARYLSNRYYNNILTRERALSMANVWRIRLIAVIILVNGFLTKPVAGQPALGGTHEGTQCQATCVPNGCILCSASCTELGGVVTVECVWGCAGTCGKLAE